MNLEDESLDIGQKPPDGDAFLPSGSVNRHLKAEHAQKSRHRDETDLTAVGPRCFAGGWKCAAKAQM